MLFFVHQVYKSGMKDVRAANMAAHRAYLDRYGKQVRLAGRMTPDNDQTVTTGMVIFEAESLHAARRFAEDQPFMAAGLIDRLTVEPYMLAYNNLER